MFVRNVTKIYSSPYRQGLMPSRAIFTRPAPGRRIFYLLASILFYFTAAACPVEAAIYYCDPNGNSATGDGSSGNPWGTLMSVAKAGKFNGVIIKGGDTVKLRTGFHGNFGNWFGYSMTIANSDYITIEADTGAIADVNFIRMESYAKYWHFKGLRISPSFSEQLLKTLKKSGITEGKIIKCQASTYITFEDCNIFTINDASAWTPNDWKDLSFTGIGGIYATNWILHGNYIHNVARGISNIDGLIEQNTIDGFCIDALVADNGIDTTIQDNVITNVYDDNDSDTHSDAIHISGDGCIVRRNYICASTNPNHTYRQLQGIYQNGANPLTNSTIENNVLIIDDNVWGITIGVDSNNVRIVNNTVIRPYDAGGWPDIDSSISTTCYNIIIRNNIAHVWPASNPSRNIVSDHNFNSTSYNLLNEFVDYPHGNVHLRAGSHFVDAGSSLNAPAEDLERNSRPRGQGYDVGAYEYIVADSNNRAPILQDIGNKSVNENTLLTFTINATDPDGGTVTYSASGLPAGASFSSPFRWTPGYDQAGTYNVTFVATDEHGAQSSPQTVTITVNNVNRPPVLAAIGNKSVSENNALSFSVSATDADGDAIMYSVEGLPSGAVFAGQTFNWTPTYAQTGTYPVTFTAGDSQAQDSETITITVGNVNRPPVLAAIGNKSVSENNALSFSVSATDPDGDTVTYSDSGLPAGASFSSQAFNWTPTYAQAGTYQVTFIASDSQAQDSKTITITVGNVNRAPVLAAIGNKSVYADDLLNFTVNASDPDGDAVEFSVNGLPSGAAFAGQNFNWQPDSSHVGSYQVSFVARDGEFQDSETITITVLSTDTSPPVVTNCSPAADSIQISLNTLVVLHITDAGKGVDADSVIIKVDGDVIYSGGTLNYSSAYGNCRRLGTKADYTYVYQSNEMFDFDQPVTVTVDAADLAGNIMSRSSHSFRTEMRSFGQNKKVGSGSLSKNKKVGSGSLSKAAPATVQDIAGNIWAAWHAGPIGSRDIYVGKLAAGADNFGSSIRLTQSTADQCNPAVAIGSDDKLYVVWQDNRSGTWDIYVSTSSDGVTWSTERKVTDSNDNQINPAIAVDNLNRAYIVWQDDRNGNQDIYIAASSDGFVTETVSQVTSNIADQIEPAIAVDALNTVYVVWTDARNGSSDIYGAAPNKGPWTNVPIVNSAGNQSSPAIAAESEGSILHLLWVDDRSGNQDIYYATSKGLPSAPLSGSNIIDDTSGANQLAPAIVTNPPSAGSKVFACWQDRRNVTVNGGDTDLYFVELTSGSGTNVLVGDDSTNAGQSEPAIGIGEYGHPYLVWTDGRSANTEIYYAGSTFVEPVAMKAKDVSASLGATVGTEPAIINSVEDVSVVVPPGACLCDIKITISKIKNPQAFIMQCLGYDFGPSGMQFSQPVTVTIPYTVPSSRGSASAYWYNSLTGALSQQGITNVETTRISSTLYALRFTTTHFTPYYLLLDSGDGESDDGGGGGGGGCSISAGGEGNIVEFLLPYLGLTVVMVILKLRDRRSQKARNIAEGKC